MKLDYSYNYPKLKGALLSAYMLAFRKKGNNEVVACKKNLLDKVLSEKMLAF